MRSSPIILVLWDVCKLIFTLCENLTLNLFSFSSARFSPDDKYSRHRVTLKRRFGILPTQQAKPVYWDTKKFCLTQDLYSELAWIGHLLFITFNLSCLVERDFWEFKCEGFVSISFMYGVIMSFKIISVIVVINIKFQKFILSKEFMLSTRLTIVPSH